MRGCLSFFAFLVVLLAALAWFAVPPAADWLVTQVLRGAMTGDVRAHLVVDLPPRLLLLHADSLHVDGTGITLGGGSISVGQLSLVLADVDLAAREAASVTGSLDRVAVAGAGVGGAALPIRHVDLAGPLDNLTAVLTVDGSTALALASADVQAVSGVAGAQVTLVAPDQLRVVVGSETVMARLAVVNGSLVAQPLTGSLGSLTIVAAGSMHSFSLVSVRVAGTDVILTGTLDRASLGF